MKRAALIAVILALFLMGSKPVNKKLVRLTIINKSGVELFIRLDNLETDYEEEILYNFTIPEGDRDNPTVIEYTIYEDVYNVTMQYVREWDPVYQYSPCDLTPHYTQLIADRNHRWVFTECSQKPPRPGEPSMDKIHQGVIMNKRTYFRALIGIRNPWGIVGRCIFKYQYR